MYNLIFHKLLHEGEDDKDIYNISVSLFEKILLECDKNIKGSYSIYFDDGHQTFITMALPIMRKIYAKTTIPKITLAITTNWINKPGFLKTDQLGELQEMGVSIASHGTSHSALAVSKRIENRYTPKEGNYKDGVFGFDKRLSEQEVLFQLIESKKALESWNIQTSEFVFPFGLYNESSILLNNNYNLYKTLSTCDEYIDEGQQLRPRYLINQNTSPDKITGVLSKLPKLRMESYYE